MTAFWKRKTKDTDNIRPKRQAEVLVAHKEQIEIKDKSGKASNVLVRPILTEKGTMLESHGQYIFEVQNSATKPEVRKAVKRLYGVTAEKVNMMSVRGRKVRFGRFEGSQKAWKKAIVRLIKGEKIDLYKTK